MTNINFRGYGGDASQTDNFDWYYPVQQDLALYSPPNPSGGGYGNGGYYQQDLALYSPPNPSGGGYDSGSFYTDSFFSGNSSVDDYIAEEDARKEKQRAELKIAADTRALELEAERNRVQLENDRLYQIDYQRRLLEQQRLLAEKEAENKRLAELEAIYADAAVKEKYRLEYERRIAIEAENNRLAELKRQADAEVERQRVAAIAEIENERQRNVAIEAEKKRQEMQKKALEDAEAERVRLAAEKVKADALYKAQQNDILARAAIEMERLAAIETEKRLQEQAKAAADALAKALADAKKTPTPTPTPTPKPTPTPADVVRQVLPHNVANYTTKPNNTLLIGGILLAVVVLYVITKDKN